MAWTKEMVEQAREFFGERFDDFILVNDDGTKYEPEVQGSEEEYLDSMEADHEEQYLKWLAESEIVDGGAA